MICRSCGFENRPGAKFCSQCDTPLSVVCPSCSAPVGPTDKVCSEGGRALRGARPAPAPVRRP